jgi:hypothetical protein
MSCSSIEFRLRFKGIFAQSKNCGAREKVVAVAKRTPLKRRSFLGNGTVNTFPAAMDKHATIEVLLETVFSTRSV